MRRVELRWILGMTAGLATLAVHAGTSNSPPVATGIQRSDTRAVPACAACHGRAGEGNAAAGFPGLAGLPAKYLAAQLDAMAGGIRQSAIMGPLARGLNEKDRVKWAAYYAALPPVRASKLLGTLSSAGAQLALRGRWSDGIPACVQCHGDGGFGAGATFPALAGQSATYLANQLRAWKLGTRRGDPLDLMQSIAKRLTDDDIRSASDYFATTAGAAPSPAPPAAGTEPPTRHGFSGAAGVSAFTPSDKPIPDDDFGKVAELGRRIFDDPAKYAGPYVGNDLRCSNCHLDEGRLAGSAPMWAAYVSYPAYRAKNHHVNTFAERLQGCFRYSMNGKAPPLGSTVLVALESYAYWMAQGAPLDPNIAGRGYSKVAKPALPPDYHRGAQVYAKTCALCHGAGGSGQRDNEGNPVFPALWGADSFNWGAGMSSVATAAAFIEADMPFGRSSTLSTQDAWDVALFVDGHERPQDPRYTGSLAETQARFHDHDDSMYGKRVNGYVLGSNSVPSGPQHHTQR